LFAQSGSLSPATQDPRSASLAASQPPGTNAFGFRVPLHAFADEAGAQRIWAAHDRYKAAFDDGFVFYPVLGPAWPENLPLAWRTHSIRVGSRELLAGTQPVVQHADWRLERRHSQVTEVYDLRADGLEQSFVLAQRPPAEGDLEIAGAITTELRCAPVAARHGALEFTDASDTPILRYGEAFAFDAAGNRIEVKTSFDGSTIRLHVDGSWLANARYPVVVDPLTAPVTLTTNPGSLDAHQPEIGRETSSAALNVCYAYGRIISASDYDLYVGIAFPKAQHATEQAITLRRALAQDFPQTPSYHSSLGAGLNNLAMLHVDIGDAAKARVAILEAIEAQSRALRTSPDQPQFQTYLANHYGVLFWVLGRQGDHRELASRADEFRGLALPRKAQTLHGLGQQFLHCAALLREDQALADAERDRLAEEYTRRGIETLSEAFDEGWRKWDLSELAHPALRGREDFRKLFARVKAAEAAPREPERRR
jgi:hypothetical protein